MDHVRCGFVSALLKSNHQEHKPYQHDPTARSTTEHVCCYLKKCTIPYSSNPPQSAHTRPSSIDNQPHSIGRCLCTYTVQSITTKLRNRNTPRHRAVPAVTKHNIQYLAGTVRLHKNWQAAHRLATHIHIYTRCGTLYNGHQVRVAAGLTRHHKFIHAHATMSSVHKAHVQHEF